MRLSEDFLEYLISFELFRSEIRSSVSLLIKKEVVGRAKCSSSTLKTGFVSFIDVIVGLMPIGENYFSGV